MATPIDAATRRLGSLVADSAMTANTTCPGFMSERPSSRSTNSQWGGKIELTRTRLKLARWASRNAISKLVSFSLCRPTPLVRKALVGMNIRASINSGLPPFVPDRGTQLDRQLRIATPVHRRLQHLRQHLRGAERHLHDFHFCLPAILAADHEHVFRRVDAQPALGGRALARHDRRPPLPSLPLDGAERVDRLDLRGRHLRLDCRGELRPPRTLSGRGGS